VTTIGSKHVLITGGASGIGRGLAARMAGLGAHVSLWDIDDQRLGAACEQIETCGGSVCGYSCDVSDRSAVDELAARTVADWGPVDVLVNNAGVVSGHTFLELTPEQIEQTVRVNVLALFWVTRAFLPAMVERGCGHVVTVASAAGLIGVPHQSDYAASKHAAVGFDEALRMELRRAAPGVVTTVVCPFYVDTGMFAGVTTRFPWLLPILKEDQVVDAILRGIQRNRRQVVLPLLVRSLPLMRLLPVTAFDQIADVLGVTGSMDGFVGRGQAH
jgi:all-trans-retinol dehydrogenase (NAD+)